MSNKYQKKKRNIGLYLTGVRDLKGGGGAERFFADFFELYNAFPSKRYNIYFIIDKATKNALCEVNKLDNNKKNIITLMNYSNRFKKVLENIDFSVKLLINRIDVIHCGNYFRSDFDRIMCSQKIPFAPKIIQNIVSCYVPHILADEKNALHTEYHERFVESLAKLKFDGVFSWYERYITYFQEQNLFPENIIKQSIKSRFVNIEKFKPATKKEKQVVFASRLVKSKNTDWFLKAISQLKKTNIDFFSEWNFLIYGGGEEESNLLNLSKALDVENCVTFCSSGDLTQVFAESSIFISAQDYENFPSMSMMEAMACGNMIISRNVGQTELIVKNNYNGLLLREDSVKGLVVCIKEALQMSEENRQTLMKNSIEMISKTHTKEAFIAQIETFWQKVLKKDK